MPRHAVQIRHPTPSPSGELAARLPISRQAVAKHLTLLAQARLVASEHDGRETRFHATPAPSGATRSAWMTAVGAQWDDRLAALGKAVTRD